MSSIRIIFIKITVNKVGAIKIYIKNAHFITIKNNITKNFIKTEYIFICIQSSKKLLINLLIFVTNTGTKFNVGRK